MQYSSATDRLTQSVLEAAEDLGQTLHAHVHDKGGLGGLALTEPNTRSGNITSLATVAMVPAVCTWISPVNEHLAIDSGGNVYEQPSYINCSIRLDASQRSQNGV